MTIYQIEKNHTFTVKWSDEDGEFVATCKEFPSLSYLEENIYNALDGLIRVIHVVIYDARKD